MTTTKGRCLCGATTFEYNGPAKWCGHCHCESCRRATSSPFTTFVGVASDGHRFTRQAPGVYRSSPGVRRLFCTTCGSPIAYESERYPGEIHFYLACLEDPGELAPTFHAHCAEQLPWIELADELPRQPRSGGG